MILDICSSGVSGRVKAYDLSGLYLNMALRIFNKFNPFNPFKNMYMVSIC
ncbi:MAG: hypothetical protein IKP28_01155 [Clostridia bacterium]|nr:hypothetical protein [Clostridia bacterium]